MNLVLSIRSELTKTKKTASVYLCILVATVVPLIFFLDLLTDSGAAVRLQQDPWNIVFEKGFEIIGFMFLPIFVILVSTLVMQVEFRNNTWKQVFASPQKLWHIVLSKLLVLHLLVLFFLFSFNILLFSVLLITGMLLPELQLFTHQLNWSRWLWLNFASYVLAAGMISIQFWLSMRIRNFIAPLAIGLSLWLLGAVLGLEMKWTHIDKYPHSYTLINSSSKFRHMETSLMFWSAGYAVFFFLVSLADIGWRKPKS